jgi:hypothetical protein
MSANACCCYDGSSFSVLFVPCSYRFEERRRQSKKEENMLHGDEKRPATTPSVGLGVRDKKKYKGHEGISKKLTEGFPGQNECGGK